MTTSQTNPPAASTEPNAEPKASGRAPIKRPLFAHNYPADPALDALLDAFASGNYALVHEQALLLAEQTSRPDVAEAARDLRARLDPDPLATKMVLGTAALLFFLIVWFYTHRL